MTATATREGAARFSFRALPETVDEKARSVRATLTTENPVPAFDYDAWDFVDESLMMDGVELPARGQVPLLDGHNRSRVKDQIGSIRNMAVEEGEGGVKALAGDLFFDSGPEGEDAFRKVREGHLTDVSVGFEILERLRVAEGEKYVLGAREFAGPINLIPRWRLLEASMTPIGADPAAKTRSQKRNEPMSNTASGAGGATQTPVPPASAQHPVPEPLGEDRIDQIKAEAQREERERQKAVREAGARFVSGPFRLPQSEVDAAVNAGLSVAEAGQRFVKYIEDHQGDAPPSAAEFQERGGRSASVQGDEKQDLIDAMAASIILRSNPALEDKLHPRAREFAKFKTFELVEQLAQRRSRSKGQKLGFGATRHDIMRAAGGGRLGERAPAMVGQDSAPNLLENVLNKSLGIGFREAEVTWRSWCRRMMASDMRDHPIPKMSQLASLAEVGEHGEVQTMGFSDKKERVRMHTWGRRLAITDDMVINDDLGFLADVPMKMGVAAARTVEELALYRLISNPQMVEDSTTLFHASHNNYVASSSGAAPSETTFQAAKAAMAKQTDPSGKVLDLKPRFLIHPVALASTVDKQLNSEWLPGATNETRNPFRGAFDPIGTPRLDLGVTVEFKEGAQTAAANATGWYLLADPSQIETLIIAFYGSEQPESMEERPIDVLGTERRIVLRFGADWGDWRGAYFNYGV